MTTTAGHRRRLVVAMSLVVGVAGWTGGPVAYDLFGGELPAPPAAADQPPADGQQQAADTEQQAPSGLERDAPSLLAAAATERREPPMPQDLHHAYERLVGAVSGDVDATLPDVLEQALPAAAEWRATVTSVPAEGLSDGFEAQVHNLEDAMQQAATCARYGSRNACIEAEQELVDIERWLADQQDLVAADDSALAPAVSDADSDDVELGNGLLAEELDAREVDLPGFVLDTWDTAAADPQQIVPLLVDDTYDQAVSTVVDALYTGTTGEARDVARVNRLVTAIRARDAMVEAAVDCAVRDDDTAHCAALPAWREHVRRTTERAVQ